MKKKITCTFMLLFVVLLTISFVGCSSTEKTTEKISKTIVGTWQNQFFLEGAYTLFTKTYIFTSDGRFSLRDSAWGLVKYDDTFEGAWKVKITDDNTIYIIATKDTGFTDQLLFKDGYLYESVEEYGDKYKFEKQN